jgi:E3 ubiquitin-protein ligase HUWE1
MSKSSGKNKEDTRKDASMPSDSEDNEEENEAREETPDLYRNSSLGIYAGVRFMAPLS